MGGWVPHISAKCQCVQNIVPHISANRVQQQARGRSLHCFPELLQLAKCHLHLFSGFVKILLVPVLPVSNASTCQKLLSGLFLLRGNPPPPYPLNGK